MFIIGLIVGLLVGSILGFLGCAICIVAGDADERLESDEDLLNTRAGRLYVRQGQFFVVVADDEPYFAEVYMTVRDQEMLEGHWTHEDETMYREYVDGGKRTD